MPTVYHADRWDAHRVAPLPDMTLVYHRRSGETHLLADPIPDLLKLLGDKPSDAASLTNRLCARLDAPADDEALAVVRHRLDELVATGLVWIG